MDMLYISDLYKRFSDKKVLNGLNLSVPEHSIFGLMLIDLTQQATIS